MTLITGWGVELDERQREEKDIDLVITKPFQIEEVLARTETHLALRKLQEQLQNSNKKLHAINNIFLHLHMIQKN